VALGQVFSENFGFPCQSTFHLLLHNLQYHPRLAQWSRSGRSANSLTNQIIIKKIVTGFPPWRPGFKPGSGHVGFCDGQKWRWSRVSPRTSVSPANLHSIYFSTIIFTITRGWHNGPGVAAVPIASQTK
jgi:hypothetical protein